MSSQNSTVLLNRLFSLKESSPFILVLDSLIQSSYNVLKEFAYKSSNNKIIYISFETLNRPSYASSFIECLGISAAEVSDKIKSEVLGVGETTTSKCLVIVDSLNYIANDELAHFISSTILPNVTLVGVFHTNVPQPHSNVMNYPSSLNLLSYIASSIFEIEPLHQDKIDEEALDNKISRLQFPINCSLNSTTYKLTLTNRRKSGRSLIYQFIVNSVTHTYEVFKESKEEDIDPEDESMLKGLTTFNLTTSSKQKLAREQVELPFMQAQEALGSSGGAIVYEFEKDDDYDEEDPYEDPF
ncbi:uncharacterized protein AC631_02271 [Debaryomyces fabryi]|uniref:Elongator complex protein 5 n=1 Tax=Debaryomyces fabryi TaxID=58627 RepID=A0A0V1Q0Q4_9ASCO|nr:uncharacterized protein AC631_02271 [Debaryomyces fabryi]KSA01980.1 hypothetical protein AC631_02271 [Debaryomyces fabryi]CUM54531.1 unnamed protein product [Debaryomyces fabryi]